MWWILAAVLVGIDQATKYAVVEWLKPLGTYPIIKNVFHLTYVENTGAAFGILQNQIAILSILVFLAVVFILYYFTQKTTKDQVLLRLSLILILAGAVGNYIDRLFRGFVVDMVDFRLIHFYVFNFADVCVCIGGVLLFYYFLFVDGKKSQKVRLPDD